MLKSLQRRRGKHMDSLVPPDSVLRFGPFELNASSAELRDNGALRRLPPQPFRVLLLLADRAGRIVTRKEIRQCLWGDRKYVDVEHGINFCMSQIRSALRDPAEMSRYIKTVPRRGYCFVAPTVRVAAGDPVGASKTALAPAPERPSGAELPPASSAAPIKRKIHHVLRLPAAAVILLALMSIPMSTQNAGMHAPTALTEKDFVVVADFANTT